MTITRSQAGLAASRLACFPGTVVLSATQPLAVWDAGWAAALRPGCVQAARSPLSLVLLRLPCTHFDSLLMGIPDIGLSRFVVPLP